MHKFPITGYKKYNDLPFDQLNDLKFSVYLIDFNWNYLFINDFVKKNLGSRANNLIGKNMWTEFKELASNSAFNTLRQNMEKRVVTNITTTSPINHQRLSIVGYPLEDCFYFSSSILPDKEDLINELRNELPKKRSIK
jgi:hypothetical protein